MTSFALVTEGTFQIQFDFIVEGGGSGEISVIELPEDFSGQEGSCTESKLNFPPYELSINCDVRTFPKIDTVYEEYDITDLTAYSSEMIHVAGTAIRGKVSKFDKAMAIASWVVENIEYDLGVGKTQETAKWTFENKVGTCDELSHLFISLASSVNLEARYVSGYAYDGDEWLPHAWAEVLTDYGWTPIDVAFHEFGYIDGRHITVYKGADGSNNFLYYPSGNLIEHSFTIDTISTKEIPLLSKVNSLDGKGDSFTLIDFDIFNPFSEPLVFFPKLISPLNFDSQVVYPQSFIIAPPGKTKQYAVLSLPEIQANYIYTIPVVTYVGGEMISTNFTVEDNMICKGGLNEIKPYYYDVLDCVDLENSSFEGVASNGKFFCNGCFYEVTPPMSRIYSYDYPSFCEDECNLTIEIIGEGNYEIEVNKNLTKGYVDVYNKLSFNLIEGVNIIFVDGVKKEIVIRRPPELIVNESIDKWEACFESNWNLNKECYNLRCGENSFNLIASYGRVISEVERNVTKDCNLWEKIIGFFRLTF